MCTLLKTFQVLCVLDCKMVQALENGTLTCVQIAGAIWALHIRLDFVASDTNLFLAQIGYDNSIATAQTQVQRVCNIRLHPRYLYMRSTPHLRPGYRKEPFQPNFDPPHTSPGGAGHCFRATWPRLIPSHVAQT